jgi:hypothetical protein
MQYLPYLQNILSIRQEIRISDPVYLRHEVLAAVWQAELVSSLVCILQFGKKENIQSEDLST